jgi:hypothetical protein
LPAGGGGGWPAAACGWPASTPRPVLHVQPLAPCCWQQHIALAARQMHQKNDPKNNLAEKTSYVIKRHFQHLFKSSNT